VTNRNLCLMQACVPAGDMRGGFGLQTGYFTSKIDKIRQKNEDVDRIEHRLRSLKAMVVSSEATQVVVRKEGRLGEVGVDCAFTRAMEQMKQRMRV